VTRNFFIQVFFRYNVFRVCEVPKAFAARFAHRKHAVIHCATSSYENSFFNNFFNSGKRLYAFFIEFFISSFAGSKNRSELSICRSLYAVRR
jgi:hypothetical protein